MSIDSTKYKTIEFREFEDLIKLMKIIMFYQEYCKCTSICIVTKVLAHNCHLLLLTYLIVVTAPGI